MDRFILAAALAWPWLLCVQPASAQSYQSASPVASGGAGWPSEPGISRFAAWQDRGPLFDSEPEEAAAGGPHERSENESRVAKAEAGDVEGHLDFQQFEPFDEREKTAEGYPIMEAIKTDHAFLMRRIGVELLASRGADGGGANDEQFTGELSWAANNRIALELDSPFIFRSQKGAGNSFGFGDTEVGLRFVAFNGERSILTFGLNVSLPTGSSGAGLGGNSTAIEPVALLWRDFGGGTVFQGEWTMETPLGAAAGGTILHYNMALGHTLRGTEHAFFFHWLTPIVEINGLTNLDGGAAGLTEINLTPGVRWKINDKDDVAVGFSFPVTAARDYDTRVSLDFCHCF